MGKHWRKFVPLILLQPLVPWWYSGYTAAGFGGIPNWALYSVLACAGYAIVVAWMLGRYWDEQAEAEPASEPEAPRPDAATGADAEVDAEVDASPAPPKEDA